MIKSKTNRGQGVMKRKRYSPEFKLKVVKEAIETGNGAMVARKHELNPNMVNRWVRTYKVVGEKNFLDGKTSLKNRTTAIYSEQEYKEIVKENEKLKKLLGEKDLEIEILRDLLKKTNPHLRIK
jgi:transposase-like protein